MQTSSSCFTPGALAPVRVLLSRSLLTYSAPSAPLAGTSRLRRLAAYTRDLRCAYLPRPRRPTTGSELSLLLFHNLSPSRTTGNSSAAYTQYFTEDTGLPLQIKISAFPSSAHSDSGAGDDFRGLTTVCSRYDLLLCLPSVSELTGFLSSHRGRLLPGFRRMGHPHRRRISLQCQLGNLHWRDFHPLDHQLNRSIKQAGHFQTSNGNGNLHLLHRKVPTHRVFSERLPCLLTS